MQLKVFGCNTYFGESQRSCLVHRRHANLFHEPNRFGSGLIVLFYFGVIGVNLVNSQPSMILQCTPSCVTEQIKIAY